MPRGRGSCRLAGKSIQSAPYPRSSCGPCAQIKPGPCPPRFAWKFAPGTWRSWDEKWPWDMQKQNGTNQLELVDGGADLASECSSDFDVQRKLSIPGQPRPRAAHWDWARYPNPARPPAGLGIPAPARHGPITARPPRAPAPWAQVAVPARFKMLARRAHYQIGHRY